MSWIIGLYHVMTNETNPWVIIFVLSFFGMIVAYARSFYERYMNSLLRGKRYQIFISIISRLYLLMTIGSILFLGAMLITGNLVYDDINFGWVMPAIAYVGPLLPVIIPLIIAWWLVAVYYGWGTTEAVFTYLWIRRILPGKPIVVVLTDVWRDLDDLIALLALGSLPVKLPLVVTTLVKPVERARKLVTAFRMVKMRDTKVVAGSSGIPDGQHEGTLWYELNERHIPLAEEGTVQIDGVQAILNLLKSSTKKVILVCIASFKDYAAAARKDPDAFENVRRVVIMGGVNQEVFLKEKRIIPDGSANNTFSPEDAAGFMQFCIDKSIEMRIVTRDAVIEANVPIYTYYELWEKSKSPVARELVVTGFASLEHLLHRVSSDDPEVRGTLPPVLDRRWFIKKFLNEAIEEGDLRLDSALPANTLVRFTRDVSWYDLVASLAVDDVLARLLFNWQAVRINGTTHLVSGIAGRKNVRFPDIVRYLMVSHVLRTLMKGEKER
ncbi:MAG: nucleoside hydrolase [Patescibacteria group bacterium]